MLGVARCAAVIPLAQNIEGRQQVEDEDWCPAQEEQEHDQDQHVDHLLHLFLPTDNFVKG